MDNGWENSVQAWIDSIGERGDWGLEFFSEPAPVSGDPAHQERARRVPWFVVMEWQRPA